MKGIVSDYSNVGYRGQINMSNYSNVVYRRQITVMYAIEDKIK